MHNLLVNTRVPPRTGFPPEVVNELFFISKLHASGVQLKTKVRTMNDPWDSLPKDTFSREAYQVALESGDLETVRIYLNTEIPIDYPFPKSRATPLLLSVIKDHAAVSSLLIQSGANVNAFDNNGFTPLHWASFNGFNAIASLLLKNGANVNAQDNNGCTPLILAVARNQANIVSILIKNGANKQLASKESGTPHDIAARKNLKDIVAMLNESAIAQ
jgi:ankyrin repeat protein